MNEQELKRLIDTANRRLREIEKLTGLKSAFAGQELKDYLDTDKVKGWSPIGRIRILPDMTESQKIAIEKATKNFLKDELSTVTGIKKLNTKYSKEAGKKISFRYSARIYGAYKNWKYYQRKYDLDSNFWNDIVPEVDSNNKEEFIDIISRYINVEIDNSVKKDLSELYNYIKDTRSKKWFSGKIMKDIEPIL